MILLALILWSASAQDALDEKVKTRLEELTRALDADDLDARNKAGTELRALLDREATVQWARERLKTAEGEIRARLEVALEPWEFKTSDHIAFVRDSNLWIMTGRGRSPLQLTSKGESRAPAFSPDGRRIAFASDRTGRFEIYLIDFDGRNEVQLTRSGNGGFDPAFSPDGTRVAFSHDGAGKGIRSVDLKGEYPMVLNEWGEWPSYSPDGKQLLLTGRSRTGQGDVFLRELRPKSEPLAVTEVLKPKALNFHARFSPDGKKIVFVGWNPGGGGGLYVMNADGGELTALRHQGMFFAWPSFLPDGKRILACRSPKDLTGITDRQLHIVQPEIVIFEEERDVVLGEGAFPAWGPKVKR